MEKQIIEMIKGASGNLAQFVAQSSFEFWERKDFRLYVEFDNLSQTEQDRIFNELEVSVLGLFVLNLRRAAIISKDERKMLIQTLEKDLPFAFLQIYRDLKIEEKYIKIWDQLIDMRLKEYEEHLELAEKESKKMPGFKKNEEELRHTWARIETITIDCLSHIRRGKVEEKDPLWKLLRKWFITLDTKLAPLVNL